LAEGNEGAITGFRSGLDGAHDPGDTPTKRVNETVRIRYAMSS